MFGNRIIVTIELPQPVTKLTRFCEALDRSWPGCVLQAHSPTGTFDEPVPSWLIVQRRGDQVVLVDEERGEQVSFPRSAIAAVLGRLNDVANGPVMLNIDGATTVDIGPS